MERFLHRTTHRDLPESIAPGTAGNGRDKAEALAILNGAREGFPDPARHAGNACSNHQQFPLRSVQR